MKKPCIFTSALSFYMDPNILGVTEDPDFRIMFLQS